MLDYKQIDFIINILNATLSVNAGTLSPPYNDFQDVDYGLRKKIFGNLELEKISALLFKKIKDNIIYCISDGFGTSFAITRLPDNTNHYFFIGPYMEKEADKELCQKVIRDNHLSEDLHSSLLEYYNRIPLLDSKTFLSTLHVIGTYIFGSTNYKIEFISKYINPYDINTDFSPDSAMELSMDIIEKRYQAENNFLTAIMKGNRKLALKAFHQFSTFKLSPRSDMIRDGKNNLIILNTLCRKAAEQCMVHPIYLDEISRNFALKIEHLNNKISIDSMTSEMIHKYCILVKNQSLHHYSPPVRKAMNYINFNLNLPLSLKEVAAATNINSNYLSTIFRKETNTTLTDYINQQKIHLSLKLLNTTDMQIQNIAWNVGINDVNYFSKLFKKLIGYTPSEYRRQLGIEQPSPSAPKENFKKQA